MRRTIKVFVGDDPRLIGMIRYSADGARASAAFEYDASWLSARDRFSIDPALQLVAGPQFHKRTRDGSIFHSSIATRNQTVGADVSSSATTRNACRKVVARGRNSTRGP